MDKLEIRSVVGLVALYATRMFGLFMVLPVLALYGPEYEGSTTLLIGVALGVYGLSQGILQMPLGMLSDRLGRKTIIIGGMLLFLLGSVVAAGAESIYTLIAGRALQGAGAVASTIMALLADLTREENRTKAMAAIGGSIGLSFGMAMIFGPVLASYWGMASIFWLTAALTTLGIVVVVLWIPTPASMSGTAAGEALTIPSLLGNTIRNGELLRLDIGVFILHMIQMASWVSIPFLLEQEFGLPLKQHWWLYLLTMGVGFILMLPLVILGERRRKLKPVFIGAIALLAAGEALLYGGTGHLWLFALAMLAFFTAFNLLEASLPSLVSKGAPGGSRGTAMGIYSSSQFIGAFIGGVVGGFIAQHFGHGAIFLFSAVLALIWIPVAATMPTPRHWSTVVVDLASNPGFPVEASALRSLIKGVEDVTCVLDHKLVYLKVDRDVFDRRELDALLSGGD